MLRNVNKYFWHRCRGGAQAKGELIKMILIDEIITIHLYFSRLTLVCLYSYLIQGITGLVLIHQQIPSITIKLIKRHLNTSF
jgi:hypothetical protein